MPALITHHIFGEDIAAELPAGIVEGEEELLAFLLGNQGPDPFFARFSTVPDRAAACHRFASLMQGGGMTRAFMALRDGVSHLPSPDERIGRAFALGLLGHYALDRAAHPFVIAQERALAEVDESLAASRRAVHALIESDIDSWILWEKRRATVQERPSSSNLMRTERIDRVGGALFSQIAFKTYGLAIGGGEYAGSTSDYERVYRLIEPVGSLRSGLARRAARLVRGDFLADACAHYVRRTDECPAANLDRHPWRHPFTGEVRTDSFADLFDEARLAYPELAEVFSRGNEARMRELVAGLNYAGKPKTDE